MILPSLPILPTDFEFLTCGFNLHSDSTVLLFFIRGGHMVSVVSNESLGTWTSLA